MNRELEKGSFTLFIFTMLTNAVNYGFQIFSARTLSVVDFGLLNTLLIFILVLSVPGNALRMVASKYIAELKATESNRQVNIFITQLFVYVTVFVLFFIIIVVAFSNVIGKLLNIENVLLLLMSILIIALTYYQFTAIGIAQGLQRFFIMSFITLILAIAKILGVIVTALLKTPLIVIFLFMIFGTILSFIVGCYMIHKKAPEITPIRLKRFIFENRLFSSSFLIKVFVANLCIKFMMDVDILLVRYFFSEHISGIYSSATLFGKILVYAVTSLIWVLYPIVAKQAAQKNNTLNTYIKSLIYNLLCVGLFLVPVLLFKKQIIIILFGQRYLECDPYIRYSCMVAVTVVLNTLNMNYLLAINKVKVMIPTYLAGCILNVVCGVYFSSSVQKIMIALFINMSLVFLINLFYIIFLGLYGSERNALENRG